MLPALTSLTGGGGLSMSNTASATSGASNYGGTHMNPTVTVGGLNTDKTNSVLLYGILFIVGVYVLKRGIK